MTRLLLTLFSFFLTIQANSKANVDQSKVEKVFIIIFENTDFRDAIKQPFFAKIAKEGALLENFYAETHPSQGNYVALTSGSTFGIISDKNITIDVRHIADLLEENKLKWKVYAENYPGNCFLYNSGSYVRKHIPFLSYKNIQNSKKRCANIVNAQELEKDIKNQNLANYSIYVPDLKNDGHNTGVSFADQWFSKNFNSLLSDSHFMSKMLFITTFDESKTKSKTNIYTSLYGDMVVPGSHITTIHDHYSLLKLVEDIFNLDDLGQKDKTAKELLDIWE